MLFENLYMSHSMHEMFNKSGMPTPEEIVMQALGSQSKSSHGERFSFDAILAAGESHAAH